MSQFICCHLLALLYFEAIGFWQYLFLSDSSADACRVSELFLSVWQLILFHVTFRFKWWVGGKPFVVASQFFFPTLETRRFFPTLIGIA